MKNLRVVFMGTPEFAVASLQAILSEEWKVVGVVTSPDKPAGRGRKIRQSAVKEFASEQQIPILQPTNLKSEEFLSDLKALRPDVQVVVAFRMLPKVVWDLPERGTFNLHASLLPQYRGAAPINWAIINGETKTGVTTFFLDEKIDTGNILLQEETPIGPTENAGELHDTLMELGTSLVVKSLALISLGKIQPISQPKNTDLKDAPKLTKENTKIDWNQSAKSIYDQIRGLYPYPIAWSYLIHGNEELRCKIQKAHKNNQKHKLPIGTIVPKHNTLQVAVKNGFILIDEIQLPGKRSMEIKEFLNGFKWKEKPYMR